MKRMCVRVAIMTLGFAWGIDALAQETLTAPSEHLQKKTNVKKMEEPKPSEPDPETDVGIDLRELSLSLPRFEFSKIERGNTSNLPPGFYASFAPPTPDTIEVFEGGTDHAEVIQVGAGKEIIQGDSLGVLKYLRIRNAQYGTKTTEVARKGKTNSTVTRTGFIPGQGFGTNRFRFAVRPGKFTLRRGAMVTASVHMTKEANNIGNILCAVTGIDYQKNVFYVEASNEIPKGESINWVIVNYQDTFSIR